MGFKFRYSVFAATVLLAPAFGQESAWRRNAAELQRFQKTDFSGATHLSSFYQCHEALIARKWVATYESLQLGKGNEMRVISWHTLPVRSGSKKQVVLRMDSYGFIDRSKTGEARYSMANGEVFAFGVLNGIEEVAQLEKAAVQVQGPDWKKYARSQQDSFEAFLKAARFPFMDTVVESDDDPINPSRNGWLVARFKNRSDAQKLSYIKSFRGVGIRTRYRNDDLVVPDTRSQAEIDAQSLNFLNLFASVMDPPARVISVDSEEGAYPGGDEVDLSRLGPDLKGLVRALLAGRANCWSRVYAVRVKLAADGNQSERARDLGLVHETGSLYQTAWSLEKIARATQYEGVVSIFSDPAANRRRP